MHSEFKAFVPAQSESRPAPATASVPADSGFVVAPQFWEALLQDMGVKQEWERRVHAEIETRIASERAKAREEGLAQGMAEGKTLGVQEGKAQLVSSLESLEAMCSVLIRDKQNLMRSHERVWSQGMHYLLKRFLVAKPRIQLDAVQAWMRECVEIFPQTAKLRLKLNPEDFDRVSHAEPTEGSWKMEPSAELAPGEVKCAFDGGELFFNESRELARLEEILAQLEKGFEATT